VLLMLNRRLRLACQRIDKKYIDKRLELEIIDLVDALVNGDFDKISAENWYGRLNKHDVEARLSEYGNTLVLPPASFLEKIDTYEYSDGSGLALDVSLWTEGEGMSDLTLSLELIYDGTKAKFQMTDFVFYENLYGVSQQLQLQHSRQNRKGAAF